MKTQLPIKPHSVHLWQVFLPEVVSNLQEYSLLLNVDEMARAKRFHFETHSQRFILARAILRLILSQYLGISAVDIQFVIGPHGKPYLKDSPLDLQFNVSHSGDRVIYGVMLNQAIGVDIEKVAPDFNQAIAHRFFSAEENRQLNELLPREKTNAFYQLWAAKEAVIKAAGQGLLIPLHTFSVDLSQKIQHIKLQQNQYHVQSFVVHPDYQAALAAALPVHDVIYQHFKT